MVDELIEAVARDAGLPREHATLAVAAMLRFFTARLPSSLVGELHARLGAPAGVSRDTASRSTAREPPDERRECRH